MTLTGFDANEEGVQVHTSEGTLRTGWLVGCGGGLSTVRRLAAATRGPRSTHYRRGVEASVRHVSGVPDVKVHKVISAMR